MFTSDMFAVMSDTCCRTIFFPPGHGVRLPMDLELDGPFAKRIRNFVANRNSFLFNGADRLVLTFLPIPWIQWVFGYYLGCYEFRDGANLKSGDETELQKHSCGSSGWVN
jgi:hypothetical protein